jgi:DNA-directed RNA polymerase subunit RPC12/RpoP
LTSLREWRCLECLAVLGHRCGRKVKLTLIAGEIEIRERDILIPCRACGSSRVWDMREAKAAV